MATGVVACVVAAVVILNSVFNTGSPSELAGGSTVQSSPVSPRTERAAVPDVCSIIPTAFTREYAPGAHVTQNDPFEADDRVSQCTWGSYGSRNRQLTILLRSIDGKAGGSGVTAAQEELADEKAADEAGKGLRAGQQVVRKEDVDGIGEEGYAVYSRVSAAGFGEGVVNVRVANVLVTVHYTGSDGAKTPLSSDAAIRGAKEAAKKAIQGLNS